MDDLYFLIDTAFSVLIVLFEVIDGLSNNKEHWVIHFNRLLSGNNFGDIFERFSRKHKTIALSR